MRHPLAFAITALWFAGGLLPWHLAAREMPSSIAPDSIDNLLTESSKRLADGDYQGAIRDASVALQLDPKNPAAYEVRGSIYIQQRLWDRAERDYAAAVKLSPDIVYKYKLAQIAFYRKNYEDAASRFVALTSDPRLGELAYYEAFLSELLGGHEEQAARDLNKRDHMAQGPSLYFCHAAWDLYHDNHAEASKSFAAAAHLYDSSTCERYISGLVETRRFQLATATFNDRAGNSYNNASVFLENGGLRVATKQAWITLSLEQLPTDLSAFPIDLRSQIERRRAVEAGAPPPTLPSLLTFTTQSGRRFDQVRWSLQNNAFAVLTPNGWIGLSIADLPTDLSAFPSDLQRAIEEKRSLHLLNPVEPGLISFTTKLGKNYCGVKALLSNDGLHVLTPDGWFAVPFRDLPDDLSLFPMEWKDSIVEGRQTASVQTSEQQVVSFTTRRGVRYEQVRASMEKGGLRVLTSDGLIAVPFAQLPSDLSAFPKEWREIVATKVADAKAEAVKKSPPNTILHSASE